MRGFYRVEDMFDFDNVGFTNTVGTTKYLSCADCDVGPIGYHDLTTKMRYLVVTSFFVSRVIILVMSRYQG